MDKIKHIKKLKELFTKVMKKTDEARDLHDKIFSEVNNHLEKTTSITKEFISILETEKEIISMDRNSSENIFTAVYSIKKFIKNAENEILFNEDFFNSFSENMHELMKVTNIFEEFSFVGERLEIISLNAYLVSRKAGDKGKSLGEITNELSVVSRNIINQIKGIENSLLNFFKYFNDLRFFIKETNSYIKDVVFNSEEYKTDVDNKLNYFVEEINSILDQILKHLYTNHNRQNEIKNLLDSQAELKGSIKRSKKICSETISVLNNFEINPQKYSYGEIIGVCEKAIKNNKSMLADSFTSYTSLLVQTKNLYKNNLESIRNIADLLDDYNEINESIFNNYGDRSLYKKTSDWMKYNKKRTIIINKATDKIAQDWINKTSSYSAIEKNFNVIKSIEKKVKILSILANINVSKNKELSNLTHIHNDLSNINKIIATVIIEGFEKLLSNMSNVSNIMTKYQDNKAGNNISYENIKADFNLINESIKNKQNSYLSKTQKIEDITNQYSNIFKQDTTSISEKVTSCKMLNSTLNKYFKNIEVVIKEDVKDLELELDDEIKNKALSKIAKNFNQHSKEALDENEKILSEEGKNLEIDEGEDLLAF